MVFSLAGSGMNYSGSCWVPLWGIFLIALLEVERPTLNVCNTMNICLCLCICLCGTSQMVCGIFPFCLLAFSSSDKHIYSLAADFLPQYETQFLWTPSIHRRPPALQQPSNLSSAGGDCWDILPYELNNSWDSQPLPLMNYLDHVL